MAKSPVEIFSGHGLGVSNSSIDKLGSILPASTIGQAQLKCFVNLNTGNLVLQDHTVEVVEENFPLHFGYIYNSHVLDGETQHWRLALTKKIFLMPDKTHPNEMIIEDADGHLNILTFDTTRNVYLGENEANGRAIVRFDEVKNQWIWYHTATQMVEIYDTAGKLVSREDSAGRATSYEYKEGEISAITGPRNNRYEIRRNQNEIGKTVEVVEIVNGLETLLHTHQFDQLDRLKTTKPSVDGYAINYSYVGNTSEFDLITQDDGTVLMVGVKDDRVTSVEVGGPQDQHLFRYDIQYGSGDQPTVVSDSQKIPTHIYIDNNANIAVIEKAKGFTPADTEVDTTVYEYTDNQLTKITFTDASIEKRIYEPNFGLMTKKNKQDGEVIELYYDNTDRPKLETQVEYLKGTPLVTRFVYDINWDGKDEQHSFLRYKILPSGSVIENRADQFGNVATQRQYLENKYNEVSNLPKNIAPSLGAMNDWVKTQSADKISLKKYGYSIRGQLQSTNAYANVDKNGNGIEDEQMSSELSQWDRYGNWLEKTVRISKSENSTTLQRFDDSLNRLTKLSQDPQGLALNTLYSYDDKNQSQAIVEPNGRSTLTTLNAMKTGIKTTQTAVGEPESRNEKIICDTDGRPIKHFRTDGKITYDFYNKEQMLGFTISRTGLVVEIQHDTKNRFQKTIEYDTQINPAQMYLSPPQEGDLPNFQKFKVLLNAIQNNNKNRESYKFFDPLGRIRFSVNAKNFITETRYDDLGRKIAYIEYRQSISDQDLQKLKQKIEINLVPNFNQDRVHQTIYNIDSVISVEIDPAGYVTQQYHDAANRAIMTRQYATPIDPQNRSLDSNITLMIPSASIDDGISYYFRDARGQIIYQVNPDGSLMFNEYLACGKLSKQRQYVNKVDELWLNGDKKNPPIMQETANDLIIQIEYDALLREENKRYSNGRCDHTEYNNMGQSILSKIYDMRDDKSHNPSKQQRTQTQYDGWGQPKREANRYVNQYMLENPDKVNEIWANNTLRSVYDGTGLKLKSVDPLNAITVYFYDEERRPLIIVNPLGVVTENTLNSFGEIVSTRTYSTKLTTDQFNNLSGGIVTSSFLSFLHDQLASAKDHITTDLRDNLGQIYQNTDAENNISTFEYNAFGQLSEENLPVESNNPTLKIVHQYEPRGLEIKTTKTAGDMLSVTEEKEYKHFLGKQTSYTDPTLNKIQSTYDKVGNLKESINGLNIITKSLIRDGRGRVTAEADAYGNTVEHQYNEKERSQTTIYPIHSVTKTLTRDIFDNTIQSLNAVGHLRTWGYDAGGQQSSFKNASLNESKKIRDLNGQLTDDVDHNGVVTKNALDLVGNICEITQNYLQDQASKSRVTKNKFNSFNQKEEVTNNRGVTTRQEFFKNGGVKTLTVDAGDPAAHLNLITQNTYNAQNAIDTTIMGDCANLNQYETKTLRDSLGRQVGDITDPNGLAIKKQSHLDLTGRTIAIVDGMGYTTRFFYDAAGNERFKIGARGDVTETVYDKNSRPVTVKTFENKIDIALSDDTSLLEVISAMSSKNSMSDSIVWSFYDANGREVFKVNSVGAVQENIYNNSTKIVEVVRYYTLIDTALVPSLNIQSLSDLMKTKLDPILDRKTYSMYDEAGRERLSIDAAGYATLKDYDDQGNIITVSCFATQIPNPSEFSKLPIAIAISSITRDMLRDRITYHVYNEFNEPVFEVDPEGGVTRYDHDELGNQTVTNRYNDRITSLPSNYLDLVTYLKTQLPIPSNDNARITEKVYDNANRVNETKDEFQKSDLYTLDALGQALTHTDRTKQSWTYKFDRAKRNTHEISPKVDVTFITQDNTQGVLLKDSTQNINIITRTEYDKNNNKTLVVLGDGTAQARPIINHFNEANNLSGVQLDNIAVNDQTKNADFINRPEKLVTLNTQKIYNMKNKVIIDVNQNGEKTFHVYDAANREIYLVSQKKGVVEFKRNAFGEVEEQISFDTPIEIDLTLYQETGIPLEIIKPLIKPSKADRYEKVKYDGVGNKINLKKGPVFSYTCTGAETPANFKENTYTETAQAFNAFKEVISQTVLMDPIANTWTEHLSWFDCNGNELVTAIKKDASTQQYYIVRKKYNRFNQEYESCEYELPINASLNPNTTSVAEIDNLLKANSSPNQKDRKTITEYFRSGSKKSETKWNVEYQELTLQPGSKPISKSMRDNLVLSWEYDDMQRPIIKTVEDGEKEYTYYDETGVVVARVDIERETQNESGETKNTFPLTKIGRDIAGQEVKQLSYYNGTAAPDPTIMPIPLKVDTDHDQLSLVLRGNRGEIRVKQDPEKILKGFTYTPLKEKIARTFHYTTNFVQQSPGQYTDAKAMDEECLFYDEMSVLKELWSIRNGSAVYKKTNTVNLFGDIVAEALDAKAPYLYRKFDSIGRVWLSNAYNNGVNTIVLHDLAGNETCKIDSESINLSTKDYADLASIIGLPSGQIDKNESIFDARGHSTTVFEPETTNITPHFSARANTLNDVIPLSMIVKTENDRTILSWILPQERIFLPSFSMWPSKDSTRIYQPELQYLDNRVFIDLSKAAQGAPLPSDIYCYSMVFSLKDPSTDESRDFFETTGQNEGKIQVDTGVNINSLSLVAIVENQNILKLTGNITNLNAVELYQDGIKLATLPVTPPTINGAYHLSLKTYVTGEYTVKGVRAGVVDDTESLRFRIFTSQVRADVPVVYEIPLRLTISSLDEYGQMVLELPDEFTRKNVKLNLNYINQSGEKKSEEVAIADPSFFQYYFPGDDKPGFSYNFKLSDKIKKIDSVDLKIQKIDDQWLQLLSGAEPTKTLDILPPPQRKIVSSYDKQLISNFKVEKKTEIENPDIIVTNFSLRQIIHVENWNDMTEQPQVSYLDMTKDRLAEQHSLDIIGYTKNDLTFDISGMQPGAYPFTINNIAILPNQHFMVFGGGQVYPCDNYYNSESRFDTYLKAMSLGLLATRAKRNETLSGVFNDGSKITFREICVKPDGDCGFTVLGIPSKNGKNARVYFRDFLESLKNDRDVRDLMALEIRSAFLIAEEVRPPDQTHWEILHRHLDIASTEKNKFRARVTRDLNLHHLNALEELEFIKHLKEKDWDKYLEFCNMRLTEYNADQDIIRYCSRQDVYLHYINAYTQGIWMGFQSAIVYAKKNKLTLHIWSRNNNSQSLRYESGYDAGEAASNVIHMLQTDGNSHFNLLHVADEVNKKDLTHELLRRANLVANTSRRTRKYQRDAWGNVTSQIDPEGNETKSEFDHNNSLVSQQSPPVVVLKSNTATPLKNPVSLTTKWGFNKRGFNIFKQDPKGNIEGYLLNKANQMLNDVLPDGTTSLSQALDVFANQVVYKDTEGNQYTQKFNRNRQLTKSTMPGNGGDIDNIYGENQLLRQQTTTGRNTSRYNYGVNADVIDSFLPAGQHTQMDYDTNHKLRSLVNAAPNGGAMSWGLDDFGNTITHTNMSNITFQTERNFKNQPIHIFQSAGTNPEPNWGLRTRFGSRTHGLGAIFYFLWRDAVGASSVPGQNLRFKYNGGRLVELQDVTNGKTSWYSYNLNNDKVNIRVKGSNNELIQEISTRYDALRREVWSFDTMCICETWFDENGNRTRLQSQVYPFGPTLPPLTTNGLNTFDDSNRQIFDLGVWNSVSHNVELGLNQGIKYIYDVNARRKRQEYLDARGLHSVLLDYYPTGLLKSTSVAGGVRTNYGYNADYQLNFYSQTNPPGSQNISSSVSSSINPNGWTNSDTQVADSYNDDHEHITSTTTTTFSQVRGTGDPNHQVNATRSYNHNTGKSTNSTDDINRILIGMDTWKLQALSVTRSNKYGRNSSIASNQYDSNGQIIAQLGVNDPDNDDPENPSSINYYYTNTPDGLTVKKTRLASGANIFSILGTTFASETRFFYSASEEILGSYEGAVNLGNEGHGIKNHSNPLINFIKSHVYNGRGASLGYNAKKGGWVTQTAGGSFTLIDRMQPLGMMWCSPRGYMYGDKFGYKAAQSLQGTNPWVTGRSYQVQPGDSWDKIAHRVYGDASYSSLIAGMNGRSGSNDVLVAGQSVRIPQFIPSHNNDKTSLPFYLLLSIVYESLYPALKTPQPKQHWWQTFVLIVAIAVAIFVAPELAGVLPGLMSALGGSLILTEAVVGAVVAGVIDAAGQGVLVLAGIDTFSWSYLAQAIIGGGVGAAAQGGAFNLTSSKLANIIVSKGMANITQQLLEMAVGIRTQLDMKSVAASMAVAGINTQLRLPISQAVQNNSPYFADAVQNAFQSVPDAFVTQEITGQKIDYAMLGVQFVAQTVGTFAGDRAAAYIHNNYDPHRDTIDYKPMVGHVPKTPAMYTQPALSQAQKQYQATKQTVEETHRQLNNGSANHKNTNKSNDENAVARRAVNPAARSVNSEHLLISMSDDDLLRLFVDSGNAEERAALYKPQKATLKPTSEIKPYNPGFFAGYRDAFRDISSRDIPAIEKIRLDFRVILFGSDPMRYNDSFEPSTMRQTSLGAGKTVLNGVFETANFINYYGDKLAYKLNPWAYGPFTPPAPIPLYSISKAEVLGANAVNGIFTVMNIVDGVKLASFGISYFSNGSKILTRDSITSEAMMRSSELRATYSGTTSADRMAMIDRLAYANYERRVNEMLAKQEYIYRYVTNENLNNMLVNGSVRGYSTTFFSHSSAEIMGRAQLDSAWYGGHGVEALIAIPTKDITGFKLARPMGGKATIGWEVFTNSYPQLGQGKIPQFIIDSVPMEGLPYMSLGK